MQSYLKINPRDTVAVALKPLAAGTVCQVDGKEVCLKEDIAQGHKFALCDMPEGTKVIKYEMPLALPSRILGKDSGYIPTISKQDWEICWNIPIIRCPQIFRRPRKRISWVTADRTEKSVSVMKSGSFLQLAVSIM